MSRDQSIDQSATRFKACLTQACNFSDDVTRKIGALDFMLDHFLNLGAQFSNLVPIPCLKHHIWMHLVIFATAVSLNVCS